MNIPKQDKEGFRTGEVLLDTEEGEITYYYFLVNYRVVNLLENYKYKILTLNFI